MGREQTEKFYDKVYSSSNLYDCHYSESIYYPIWSYIMMDFVGSEKVLDLGCGVGQFAEMCKDNDVDYVAGIDFSGEAIRQAKKRCLNFTFEQQNLVYDLPAYDFDYNTIVCLEVLEHVFLDYRILNRCKSGSRIYFSVPNFDSEGHVRYFKHQDEVFDRYSDYFDKWRLEEFDIGNKGKKIYLVIARFA